MTLKTYWIAALFIALLTVCGCESFHSNICNVSIGPTKGIVLQDNSCNYPGLVTLPDGNLLAANPCLGPVLMTELSRDKGATWEPGTSINVNGSADAIALLPNGTLLLTTSLLGGVPIGVPIYMIGTIGTNDLITWSAPVSVNTPGWTAGCWAVSPVVSLGNGALVWPVWCFTDATETTGSSTVLLSRDNGVTWPKQVTVGNAITDGRDYDESAAVVYPNGDIVMIIRQTSLGPTDHYGSFWRSKSTDGGNTWSAPTPVVKNIVVGRPALVLLPSGGLVLLSRSRSGTGFGTSWDGGLTFSLFTDLGVNGGPGYDLYDAMSLLPDGSIAVVAAHFTSDRASADIDYRNLVDHCSSSCGTPGHVSCSGGL
jgi:BNR repeat-like domain